MNPEELAKALGIPTEYELQAQRIMREREGLDASAEPWRPESVVYTDKTGDNKAYWSGRTVEKRPPRQFKEETLQAELLEEVKEIKIDVKNLQALHKVGIYLLISADRVWVKWGSSHDVTDPKKGRLLHHIKRGW